MIQNLLSRLDKSKPNGKKKWMACCPAHNDSDPSLAIKLCEDGKILLHCFAGCGASDILTAVGLEMTDLFPDSVIDDLKDWKNDLRREEQRRRLKKQKEDLTWGDRATLTLANGDRKQGRKLSRKELEIEAQAYIRMRNANNNR